MPPRRHNLRSNRSAGHLLILGCSDRKRAANGKLPALDLYDGVNFRVLRTFLNEHGWPPGLCVKILSAKYGLLDATDLRGSNKTYPESGSSCKRRKQMTQAASVSQASWITPRRS